MNDFISRTELLAALERVGKDARDYAHGEYDSVKRAQYEAKAEVCVELAAALTLPAKVEHEPCPRTLARAVAAEYPERATQCTCPGYGTQEVVITNETCPVHARACECDNTGQHECPIHKATK